MILYKKTSTGAIQVWYQELVGNQHRSHSGKDGGKIVTSAWTTCEGKNIGRANQTSGEEQARLEVEANYVLKRKGGYRASVADTLANTDFKPMLANKFPEYEKHVQKIFDTGGTVEVQPKLDGMRCIAMKHGLFSRTGSPIPTVPHIVEALRAVFTAYPGVIIDGELYNHDLKHDFPQLMSLVKKQKPTEADFKESAKHIQYHIYDVATRELSDNVRNMLFTSGYLIEVPSTTCGSLRDIDTEYGRYLENGYEGAMVRLKGPYEQKRSKLLLKYKPLMDAEFKLVDITEGVGNRAGMAGRAYFELPDGRTFKANVMGNRSYLKNMLNNKSTFIGKEATVLFNDYTPDGIPRFGRVKVFHETERW